MSVDTMDMVVADMQALLIPVIIRFSASQRPPVWKDDEEFLSVLGLLKTLHQCVAQITELSSLSLAEGDVLHNCYQAASSLATHIWVCLHGQPWNTVDDTWRCLYAMATYTLAAVCALRCAALLDQPPTGIGTASDRTALSETQNDETMDPDIALTWAVYYADMGLIMGGGLSSGVTDDDLIDPRISIAVGKCPKAVSAMVSVLLYRFFHEHGPVSQLETRLAAASFRTELPTASHPSTPSSQNSALKVGKFQCENWQPQTIVCPPEIRTFDIVHRFFKHKNPVVLQKRCAHWDAISQWQDVPEKLLRCGRRRLIPVEVGSSYTSESWSQKIMTIHEYVARFLLDEEPGHGKKTATAASLRGYIAQHPLLEQMPQLKREFLLPDEVAAGTTRIMASTTGSVPYFANARAPAVDNPDEVIRLLWIGPKDTVSPFHTDEHDNFFVQISGYKYIQLIPPEETPNMYCYPTILNNTSSIVPADVFQHPVTPDSYPLFPAHKAQHVFLGPGDALFIPKGWWHFVKALTTSVSASYWFTVDL